MIVETIKKFLPVLVVILLSIPTGIPALGGQATGSQGLDSYEVYGEVLDEDGNEIEAHIVFEHLGEKVEIDADGWYRTDISALDLEYGDRVNVTAAAYDLSSEESFVIEEDTEEKRLDLTLSGSGERTSPPPVDNGELDNLSRTEGEQASALPETPPYEGMGEGRTYSDEDLNQYSHPETMVQPRKAEKIDKAASPLPDLTVDVSVPDYPIVGSELDINVTVSNDGVTSVEENVTVEFILNEQRKEIKIIQMTGDRTSVAFDWTPDTGGIHELKVAVDPADEIVETDEENNHAVEEVMVYTASDLIDEVKDLLDSFKDDVDQMVDRPQAIKALIKDVKRDLDSAETGRKDWQKIQNINDAVDKEVSIADMLARKRDRGDVSEEDASYLIGEMGGITDKTVWISYAFLPTDEMKDLCTAEAETVKALFHGKRFCYEESWWDTVESKLKVSLENYQTAVFKEAKDREYQDRLDTAYKYLDTALDELPEEGGSECADEIRGHIVSAIMVFPPNMSVDPFDIDVEGDLVVGSRNRITFTVHNTGEVKVWKTGVEVYARTGESREVLKSYEFKNIRKGGEKTRSFWWTPESPEDHYIGVEIDAEDELVESSEKDNSAETSVGVVPDSTRYWEDGYVVEDTKEFSDDVILMWGGDLYIPNGTELIFHNITFRIESPEEYYKPLTIHLNETGSFKMDRESTVKAKQWQYPYKFMARGDLDITDSTVKWMWGDGDDFYTPSGIMVGPDGDCDVQNGTVKEGYTNNFYVDGGSLSLQNSTVSWGGVSTGTGNGIYARDGASVTVDGTDVTDNMETGVLTEDSGVKVTGTSGSTTEISNNEIGIRAFGGRPRVENSTITSNTDHGIAFQQTPGSNPAPGELEDWSGSSNDKRITRAPERSARPKIATGGGDAYMVWLDNRSGSWQVYFSRAVGGLKWTDPVQLTSEGDEPGYADVKADGENVLVVWGEKDIGQFELLYSDDRGETWGEPAEFEDKYHPSIELSGSDIYLTYSYTYFDGQELFIFTHLYWTTEGQVKSHENDLGLAWSTTDIEVVKDTIYLAALSGSDEIYYWRSDDNGETWTIDKKHVIDVSTEDWTIPPNDWIDLSVNDGNLGILWSDNRFGRYEVLGVRSDDSGASWTSAELISDTLSPDEGMWPTGFIDGDNRWHISWEEGSSLYYTRKDVITGDLEAEKVDMTPGFSSPRWPDMALGEDRVHYVWEGEYSAQSEIFTKSSTSYIKNSHIEKTPGIGKGIALWSSSVLVENNTLRDGEVGVYCGRDSQPVVYDNHFQGNYSVGVHGVGDAVPEVESNVINGTDTGIYLFSNTKRAKIYDNTITNNEHGIYTWGSSPSIRHNDIRYNNRTGVWSEAARTSKRKAPYISQNRIVQNEYGVYSETSDPIILDNPEISYNKVGIGLFENSTSRIKNNTIKVQQYGIYGNNSTTNIENNTVTGRGVTGFDRTTSEEYVSSSNRIYLKSTYLDTSKSYYESETISTEAGSTDKYVLQFVAPPKSEWIQELKNSGVKLFDYIPNNAYLVSNISSETMDLPYVRWIGEYKSSYKLDSSIEREDETLSNYTVQMCSDTGFETDLEDMKELVDEIKHTEKRGDYHYVDVVTNGTTLSEISTFDSVIWAERSFTPKLMDEVSSEIIGGKWSPETPWDGPGSYVNSLGYTGDGVNISIADTGMDTGKESTMHNDLRGKISYSVDYTEDNTTDGVGEDTLGHGTHVAGIAAGDATVGTQDEDGYLYGMGVAPNSTLLNQRVFGDDGIWQAPPYGDITRDAVQNGAVVGSNSWGGRTYGEYTSADQIYDKLVRDADNTTKGDQEYTLVFSAGNSGPWNNTIGSPAVAKNVISVGASENYRPNTGGNYSDDINEIAEFSSRGPTDDGRIKPDVVAPGSWVSSARATEGSIGDHIDENYTYLSGTSMAAPHVAGASALFVQHYKEEYSEAPSPALIKTALINGADRLPGKHIPNPDEGWGRVNLTNTLETEDKMYINEEYPLSTGEEKTLNFVVSDPTKPLRITMAYTDAPGSLTSSKALTNNLDLSLQTPTGTRYAGNQFTEGWSDPWKLEFDETNNVECIYIPPKELEKGMYRVKVKGTSIVRDSINTTNETDQDFGMTISGGMGVTSKGFVTFDSPKYQSDDTALASVFDSDLNTDPEKAERYKGPLFGVNSTSDETQHALTIVETGENTSIFQGDVPLTSNPDESVYVQEGDIVTATYNDEDQGDGNPATVKDTAVIDDTPPVIDDVGIEILPYSRAKIHWRTDEDANSTVRYGKNKSIEQKKENFEYSTEHEVLLSNLSEGNYYFAVESTDRAGNIGIDDNDGDLYKFRIFDYSPGGGIFVSNDSYSTIHNNEVGKNFRGIIDINTERSDIRDNMISDNLDTGIYNSGTSELSIPADDIPRELEKEQTDQRLTFSEGESTRPATATYGDLTALAWTEKEEGGTSNIHLLTRDDSSGGHAVHSSISDDSDHLFSNRPADSTGVSPSRYSVLRTEHNSSQPSLAYDSNGYLHMVWREIESNTTKIYYINSYEMKQTVLYDGGDKQVRYPNIVFTLGGDDPALHVIFSEGPEEPGPSAGPSYVKYVRSFDGISWSSPETIGSARDAARANALADGEGNVYVAWEDWTWDHADFLINFIKSEDNGDTWSASEKLVNESGNSIKPQLASRTYQEGGKQKHVLYLTWHDNRDGNYEIYAKSSSDFGDTWTSDTRLTSSSKRSTRPDITIDSKGMGHILWVEGKSGDNKIYYQKIDPGCNLIVPEKLLTPSATSTDRPAISIDENDHLDMFWQDKRDGNWEIYTKTMSSLIAGNVLSGNENNNMYFTSTVDLTVRDNVLEKSSLGITVRNESTLSIINNRIASHTGEIYSSGGISISGQSKVAVTYNEVTQNDRGIGGGGHSRVLLLGNNVHSNLGHGMFFSGYPETWNNVITHNGGIGLRLKIATAYVDGNEISYNGLDGIEMYQQSHNVFHNNISHNGRVGIYMDYSYNHVANNTFIDNYRGVICVRGRNIVEDNTFHENTLEGIIFSAGRYGTKAKGSIERNDISSSQYGIVALGSEVDISNNSISNLSATGILSMYDDDTIDNNSIYNATRGIRVVNSTSVITNNNITRNGIRAVTVLETPGSIISNNNISYNGVDRKWGGIVVLKDSPESEIKGNYLRENKRNAYAVYSTHSDGVTVQGNEMIMNNAGVRIDYSNDTLIEDNYIVNKKLSFGIILSNPTGDFYSSRNKVNSNTIEGVPNEVNRGITVYGTKMADTTITYNRINGTYQGILSTDTYCTVRYNEVNNSWRAVQLRGQKIRPEQSWIDSNLLVNNTYGVYIDNWDTSISPRITSNTIRNNEEGIHMHYKETEDWEMYRNGKTRSGYTDNQPAYGQIWWHYDIGGESVMSSPAVVDDKVYIGSSNGKMYCLDIEGNLIWSYQANGAIYSSPAVVNGNVYFGSNDDHLYSLDADSGTEQWSFNAGDDIISSPVVHNDTVYFGSLYSGGLSAAPESGGRLYAVNATTGQEVWHDVAVNSDIYSSPSIIETRYYTDDNVTEIPRLYYGDTSGTVHCLDAADGREIWDKDLDGEVKSSVIDGFELGRQVIVGSTDGYLYALEKDDGAINWTTEVNPIEYSSPANERSKYIYTASADGNLTKVQAWDGSKIWKRKIGDEIVSSISISPDFQGGVGFIGVDDKPTAIDLHNGDIIAQDTIRETSVYSSPAVTNDGVFVATAGGELIAYRRHPVIEDNTIVSNSQGITVANTRVKMLNNEVEDNSAEGIYLNNTVADVEDNSITGNNEGIFFTLSELDLSNNRIVDNQRTGVSLHSSNATIVQNNISNNRGDGIYLYTTESQAVDNGLYEPEIMDNKIQDNGKWGIHMRYMKALNSDTIASDNPEMDGSNGEGMVWQEWFAAVEVVDGTGTPTEGASVTIDNYVGETVFTGTTDSNGMVTTTLTEYYIDNSGDKRKRTPHLVRAEKDGLSGWSQADMTQNYWPNEPINVLIVQ